VARKYKFFKKIVNIKINKIKKIIYLKYNQGYKLGCFTASSKGNTLLNCLNIEKKIIKFSFDNEGFPKSRSIKQLNFYLKYFILIYYKNFFVLVFFEVFLSRFLSLMEYLVI